MTERTRPPVQTDEMGFLRRVANLSLRDSVRSLAIREELGVKPLVLHVERIQLRWFGTLVRMPPWCLPRECSRHVQLGGCLGVDPRPKWRD